MYTKIVRGWFKSVKKISLRTKETDSCSEKGEFYSITLYVNLIMIQMIRFFHGLKSSVQ